jgi:catechol 2,3-dioxygenase-like lactoylglutathione lyase family enzyme
VDALVGRILAQMDEARRRVRCQEAPAESGVSYAPGGLTMRLLLTAALVLFVAAPAAAQLAPPNAAGITYGHVHLSVKDIEVHKKLWVDHFGGVVTQKGTLTAVRLPGMLIAFRGAGTGPSEGTAMDHFGFKVRNLAEVLKGWRDAGYKVTQEFIGSEGFPNAYLIGPDDVKIELQEDKALPVKASAYHIHFLVPDPAKLRDWYVDMFSLTPRPRGKIEITADAPGMNLSFGVSKMPLAGTRGRAIDHIGFEVTNLEAFVKKLEARGIKFDVAYREVPAIELKIAYLTDPSGVYIELTEGYNKY